LLLRIRHSQTMPTLPSDSPFPGPDLLADMHLRAVIVHVKSAVRESRYTLTTLIDHRPRRLKHRREGITNLQVYHNTIPIESDPPMYVCSTRLSCSSRYRVSDLFSFPRAQRRRTHAQPAGLPVLWHRRTLGVHIDRLRSFSPTYAVQLGIDGVSAGCSSASAWCSDCTDRG